MLAKFSLVFGNAAVTGFNPFPAVKEERVAIMVIPRAEAVRLDKRIVMNHRHRMVMVVVMMMSAVFTMGMGMRGKKMQVRPMAITG